MEIVRIQAQKLEPNKGQIDGLATNPRQWTKSDIDRIAQSLKETPELFEMRPCIVIPNGDKYVVLGGNLRLEGARKNKTKEIPCIIVPEETPTDKLKEIVIKDNGSFGSWDFDELANKWDDLPLVDWGVPAWDNSVADETPSAEEIERKKKEFEERIRLGEISEEDEEYQEFLEKFKLKKTTDDCYTPKVIYEAVAQWVADRYNLETAKFVRPFYPGGDYKNFKYNGMVVVDNPPFSILAEILDFYNKKAIPFFLFAPTLTLFSTTSSVDTCLPLAVAVTYDNGANVSTSFITNLEDSSIRVKSEPSLYKAVKEANDENLKNLRKQLPKYNYDHHIITSTFVSALSRLGIPFSVPMRESEPIAQMDAQKASGKAIYGKGYIVSERVFQEREKAEREKAERWELSDREKKIVQRLTENV